MSAALPRAVLAAVIALHLVAETSLSPFYPELFRRLFGIDDLAATGTYVWVARVAGLVALPLWGLAARRWALRRLIVAGLAVAAVLDLALGFAPTWGVFTALTAAIVAVQSALLLAYPAFVGLWGGGGDRLPAVRSYVVVFHLSMAVSALVGAGVMALPQPRVGISAFAVVDVVLAWLTARVLVDTPDAGVREPGTARRAAGGVLGTAGRAVLAVAGIAALFDLAANVPRPFFTEYAFTGGYSVTGAAVLYLFANVGVVAAVAGARLVADRLGGALAPAAFAAATAGLAVQAVSLHPAVVVPARLLFGAGLGLGHLALDLRMFAVTGTSGPRFAAVETVRSAALLATPVVATLAATAALALPLAVAAALFAVAAVVATRPAPSPDPRPQGEDHALGATP